MRVVDPAVTKTLGGITFSSLLSFTMTIYGKVVFILNINVTDADRCLHCLFVDDGIFQLREVTEMA